jgi:hypothetical protein
VESPEKPSTTAGAASVKAPTRLCSVKADERHDEQVQRNHASSLCQLPATFYATNRPLTMN